jgi:hypothetical protein
MPGVSSATLYIAVLFIILVSLIFKFKLTLRSTVSTLVNYSIFKTWIMEKRNIGRNFCGNYLKKSLHHH